MAGLSPTPLPTATSRPRWPPTWGGPSPLAYKEGQGEGRRFGKARRSLWSQRSSEPCPRPPAGMLGQEEGALTPDARGEVRALAVRRSMLVDTLCKRGTDSAVPAVLGRTGLSAHASQPHSARGHGPAALTHAALGSMSHLTHRESESAPPSRACAGSPHPEPRLTAGTRSRSSPTAESRFCGKVTPLRGTVLTRAGPSGHPHAGHS